METNQTTPQDTQQTPGSRPVYQINPTIDSANPPVKRALFPNSLKIGLLIFLLTSAIVLIGLPRLDHSKATTPSFSLFLTSGLVMVVLTSLFFLYLSRLRMGFSATAIVLAVGFNSVIAVIKFILSPYALYLANKQYSFSTSGGNPNSMIYYLLVAVFILSLYMLIFRLVYRYHLKRIYLKQGKTNVPKSKGVSFKSASLSLTGLFVIAAILLGFGVILLPILLVGASFSYLGYVFGALGIPLIIAIALGIFLANKAFGAVEKQVMISGDATLLASFFWLGLSIIVLYHIMWIIFMLTLVHIWPFNTYTPK